MCLFTLANKPTFQFIQPTIESALKNNYYNEFLSRLFSLPSIHCNAILTSLTRQTGNRINV